jgi:hypothetical protein
MITSLITKVRKMKMSLFTNVILISSTVVSSAIAQESYYEVINCEGGKYKAPTKSIAIYEDESSNTFLMRKDNGNVESFALNSEVSKNTLLPNGHQVFETSSSEITPYEVNLSYSRIWNNCLGAPMGHVVNGKDNYKLDLSSSPNLSFSWDNIVNVDKVVKSYTCELKKTLTDPGEIIDYRIDKKNNTYIVTKIKTSSFKVKTEIQIESNCQKNSYYLFDKVKCDISNSESISETFFF